MNSIEKDFRSEMSQIETERLDEEMPKILAGKMERFTKWCIDCVNDKIEGYNYIAYIDGEGIYFDTLSDLYQYFIDNVEGK